MLRVNKYDTIDYIIDILEEGKDEPNKKWLAAHDNIYFCVSQISFLVLRLQSDVMRNWYLSPSLTDQLFIKISF